MWLPKEVDLEFAENLIKKIKNRMIILGKQFETYQNGKVKFRTGNTIIKVRQR